MPYSSNWGSDKYEDKLKAEKSSWNTEDRLWHDNKNVEWHPNLVIRSGRERAKDKTFLNREERELQNSLEKLRLEEEAVRKQREHIERLRGKLARKWEKDEKETREQGKMESPECEDDCKQTFEEEISHGQDYWGRSPSSRGGWETAHEGEQEENYVHNGRWTENFSSVPKGWKSSADEPAKSPWLTWEALAAKDDLENYVEEWYSSIEAEDHVAGNPMTVELHGERYTKLSAYTSLLEEHQKEVQELYDDLATVKKRNSKLEDKVERLKMQYATVKFLQCQRVNSIPARDPESYEYTLPHSTCTPPRISSTPFGEPIIRNPNHHSIWNTIEQTPSQTSPKLRRNDRKDNKIILETITGQTQTQGSIRRKSKHWGDQTETPTIETHSNRSRKAFKIRGTIKCRISSTTFFEMSRSTSFRELRDVWAKETGVNAKHFTIMWLGKQISLYCSPEELLENTSYEDDDELELEMRRNDMLPRNDNSKNKKTKERDARTVRSQSSLSTW